MPRGWSTVGTGELIRGHLLDKGESYPKEVYTYLNEFIDTLESSTGKPYEKPSYMSVRKYLYVLKELGLITFTREKPVRNYPTAFHRRYFRIVPGMETDPRWRNPYTAKYYPEKFGRLPSFPPVEARKWRPPIPKR